MYTSSRLDFEPREFSFLQKRMLCVMQDEKFSCCRFSQDGSQAFLFVSITKGEAFFVLHCTGLIKKLVSALMCVPLICLCAGRRGYVGVWNMVDWSRIGAKKLSDDPITSLAVSRNGKWMGL